VGHRDGAAPLAHLAGSAGLVPQVVDDSSTSQRFGQDAAVPRSLG
jgi:hypothetical protein